MTDTGIYRQRLTIRIGCSALAFCATSGDSDSSKDTTRTIYEPFVVKSGVSMAANLREAFKTADLLQQPPQRVRVMLDSDIMVMPVEQFDESSYETIYCHSFPDNSQDVIYYTVLPDLNAVAVYAMNKDLRMVVDDHFQNVTLLPAMSPVWRHLHQRSFTGKQRKLYAYFHEGRLELLSFQQNRFRFCNSFQTARAHDAIFFILYVWKQLMLEQEKDELHIVGDAPEREWLESELHKYLQKVFFINPAADLNNHPVTEIKGMPYDMMTLIVKGR